MRQVRKALGYTQNQMVAFFDIGRADYSRIEKGEVLPNVAILKALRTQFNISLDWLITNTGKMMVMEKSTPDKKLSFPDYSQEITEMLELLGRVPMVKHAILGFFLEYKVRYDEIIQKFIGEDAASLDPIASDNEND